MISYAQNGEDVLLERAFRNQARGFYVDLGAADPIGHSVTKHFYEKGWHGINVEPMRHFFTLLAADRPRDVNLRVGVSNQEGKLTFYEGPDGYGGSTFNAEVADDERKHGFAFKKRSVPVTTLARICEEHAEEPIDFLKVDVEGHEREVLEGADFERWRPRVVVMEATVPHSNTPNHEHWEKLLVDADYCFATFDGINRFYVRVEDRDLVDVLSVPLNVLDEYEPYEFIRRLDELQHEVNERDRAVAEANAQIGALEARAGALEASTVEMRAELGAVTAEFDSLRARLGVYEQALSETRAELSASQMTANDMQLRLIAAQSALMEAHVELTTARQRALEAAAAAAPPARFARLRRVLGVVARSS